MPGKHSGFKMYGKSPMMKKLIGDQYKLPKAVREGIEAAPPTKMYGKKASAVKNYKKGYYGA